MTTLDNAKVAKSSTKISLQKYNDNSFEYKNNYFTNETKGSKNIEITTLDNAKVAKSSSDFFCIFCDYFTIRQNNYIKHCQTMKHKNNAATKSSKDCNKMNEKKYECVICDKAFKDRAGLWRHKKKCFENNENNENNKLICGNENENENNIIHFLMKENSEFKQLLLEQNKQIIELANKTSNNIFNNNTNSHNKTFNLNMFLNETCKNAMNISDFADSIQLQLSDLESVGELGYVNGISNIIIKNLKELDITQRPIHCTDVKRETLYIKDKNKWEKEGEQKEIIVTFVNNIANKNIRMLNEFKKKYPDCCKYESKYSDYYSKLVVEAMGGSGGTDAEKNEKIIKKITREVTIHKELL
jgi:hypothetical protein